MISEDNEIDVHISIVTICKDSSNFMFPTKLHRSNVKKKNKIKCGDDDDVEYFDEMLNE